MISVARAIDALSGSRSTEKVFLYGGRAAQDIAGEQFLSGMSTWDWTHGCGDILTLVAVF